MNIQVVTCPLLDTLYEDSKPSAVQALLLLGVRELGIGSFLIDLKLRQLLISS